MILELSQDGSPIFDSKRGVCYMTCLLGKRVRHTIGYCITFSCGWVYARRVAGFFCLFSRLQDPTSLAIHHIIMWKIISHHIFVLPIKSKVFWCCMFYA